MAVFDGHVEVVAYLIDHGARTDVHIDYGSMRKASILDVAVDGWDEAMVDFLESKGVKQKSKYRLKLDYDVLRQVFNVYSEEGFNIMETLNRVNRMKLPTPTGAKAWTLVMVTKAAKLVGG